jgi:hypothetical protein
MPIIPANEKPDPATIGFRPLLIELAHATGGSVTPLDAAVADWGALRTRTVLQRPKYSVDLDIGCGIVRIPVCGHTYTSEEKVESLKKTTVRMASRDKSGYPDEAGMDDGPATAGPRAKEVSLDRFYVRKPLAAAGDEVEDADEPVALSAAEAAAAEELTADQITKAFKYGGTYVIPFAGDSFNLKPEERSSFKLLGAYILFPLPFAIIHSSAFLLQASSEMKRLNATHLSTKPTSSLQKARMLLQWLCPLLPAPLPSISWWGWRD